MWGLVLKDFYNNRKHILLYFLIALAPALFFAIRLSEDAKEDIVVKGLFIIGQMLIIAFIFVGLGGITHTLMKTDEHTEWMNFIVATPCSRRTQVLEKYIVNLIMLLAAAGYTLGLIALSNSINGVAASKTVVFVIFIFFVFQSSIDLPMDFVAGTKYGNYVKIALTYFLIAGFILYGLYGELPDSLSFDSIMDFLMKLFNNGSGGSLLYRARYGAMGITAMYIVSFLVTVKLYNPGATLEKQ